MRSSDRPASVGGRLGEALLAAVRRASPRMRVINAWATVVAIGLAIATMLLVNAVLDTRTATDDINEAYNVCQKAADDLGDTSDFLTSQARLYVTTKNPVHLDNYLDEVDVLDRRGRALETLRNHAMSADAVVALETADDYSNELAVQELLALRLVADVGGVERRGGSLAAVEVDESIEQMTDESKLRTANELVYGDSYNELKMSIRDQVHQCSNVLVDTLGERLAVTTAELEMLISAMYVAVALLALTVVVYTVVTRVFLLSPMETSEELVRSDDRLIPGGAKELRTLIDAYNEIYDANHFREESLSYEANHDALTGVYNRGAFDSLLTRHKHACTLLLVDVDNFKHFNDDYGHEMGDAVLVEVAAVLFASFRSTDHICRIGGDEFAVIATGMGPESTSAISAKIESVREFLRDTENGLPTVTVSVGIAFGWKGCGDSELFQEADQALYGVKESGRDGYAFAKRDIIIS